MEVAAGAKTGKRTRYQDIKIETMENQWKNNYKDRDDGKAMTRTEKTKMINKLSSLRL